VDDAEAALPWLRKCDVKIVDGPKPRPDGYMQVFVEDPDGHVIRFGSEPRSDQPFEEFIE